MAGSTVWAAAEGDTVWCLVTVGEAFTDDHWTAAQPFSGTSLCRGYVHDTDPPYRFRGGLGSRRPQQVCASCLSVLLRGDYGE